MLAKERLRASTIALPTFAEPRPDRALDPELPVVQKSLEEPERSVEVLRVHEVPEAVRGDSTPPGVLGAGPP